MSYFDNKEEDTMYKVDYNDILSELMALECYRKKMFGVRTSALEKGDLLVWVDNNLGKDIHTVLSRKECKKIIKKHFVIGDYVETVVCIANEN
jgi:hypothetical protein